MARGLEKKGLVTISATAQRKVADKKVRRVTLAVSVEEAMAAVEPRRRSAPMRYEVIRLLCTTGSALSSDLCYFTGASPQTLRSLEKSGLVTMTAEEVLRVPRPEKRDTGPILLSEEQQAAYDSLTARMDQGQAACALLYGVTGSGKTSVYIRLLQEVVRRGKRGMVLVPEIALTPQMMSRFGDCFGDRVVMLHSGLRMSEREQLSVGEPAPLPCPGRGKVPLRPAQRRSGAGLCHAVGGEHLPGPARGLPEADPPLPV